MKSHYAKCFTVLALSFGIVYIASAESVKPDPELAHYLSPSGPLSAESMKKIKSQKSLMESRKVRRSSTSASSNTYTYLRCFYHTSGSKLSPTTDYVWGIDPSSGSYYTINGYWYAGGALDWENMFYSSVSQTTLKNVCQSTLANKGIKGSLALYAAADNALSFNYTVWTNDNASQASAINKIVAFGDSLSDNQNIYNASLWTLPNRESWFLGRFSNDENWIEYVSDSLKLPLYNWAVGGAGVDTQELVIPGVIEQEHSWQQYMQMALNYRPENTLFTLLIGGNDLVNYNVSVDTIVADETQTVQNMINAGARNILLLNLPDLSRAPVFKYKTNGAQVAAQVLDLNGRLATMAGNFQSQYGSNLKIRLFDTYALFNQVLSNPASYGVSNSTDSCLNINADSSLNYLATQTPRAACSNPDTYVFWDTLHPTTHTHKLLATSVSSFIQANF